MPNAAIDCVQFYPILCNNTKQIEVNTGRILQIYKKSTAALVLFPELAICGYIPQDLLFHPHFIDAIELHALDVVSKSGGQILCFGSVLRQNGKLYNVLIICQNGKILQICKKTHLPNNSVFSESRYFTPNTEDFIVNIFIENTKIAFAICEDIWHENFIKKIQNNNPHILCVANASPYNYAKQAERYNVVKSINIPTIYCNLVGAMDGICFDGASFASNGTTINQQAKIFEEQILPVNFATQKTSVQNTSIEEGIYKAMIFTTKDFFAKCGFTKAVLGLSGGADSALVLKIASDALGPKNVFCYGLKSKYTSSSSIEDALVLVQNISNKIHFEIIDIEPLYQPFVQNLGLEGLNLQNIQARVRGAVLMAKSAQHNALVLTTGNKSEIACGYCTIYGDMCGAFNPIKDLYKTQVFAMMQWLEIFPQNILTKPPSAELSENQKDSDNLPPYNILDPILYCLIELTMSVAETLEKITKKNAFALNFNQKFNVEDITKAQKLLRLSEYKRRQSAPGPCLSPSSFEPQNWRANV